MKRSYIKKHFLLLLFGCLLLATNHIYSQSVGINTVNPSVLTELDIKNIVNGTDTIPKGIMIPRITEAQRNSILVTQTDTLTANSLLIYNTDEGCYNYYSRTDNEWRSLCGTPGKAVFSLNCDSVKVHGTYIVYTETTSANYISLYVDVAKKGIWTITAIPKPTSNGYSFVGQGIFTETGKQWINLPAQGTPQKVKEDLIEISGSGSTDLNALCYTRIFVQPRIAEYTINCSTVSVEGIYRKGVPLNSSNVIKLMVNVSKPGSYYISTPVVKGISFSTVGPQLEFTTPGYRMVILTGKGTPTVNSDFPIEIRANTASGNNTCNVTIPITLPAMTFAVIGGAGTGNWYSWNGAVRSAALTGGSSFGPSGKVKMAQPLVKLWDTSNAGTATNHLNNGFNGKYPDIVLYSGYETNSTPASATALSAALIDYINKGGCIMYAADDNSKTYVDLVMSGVFGTPNISSSIGNGTPNTDDQLYMINHDLNDPIINGPFGYLGGKYWGEDNVTANSMIIDELPPHSVQICSANNSVGHKDISPLSSIVWYNDRKNFAYIGDTTGANNNQADNRSFPACYTNNGFPLAKQYGYVGDPALRQFVYNSALEMNIIAYLIKKAAVSGINPH